MCVEKEESETEIEIEGDDGQVSHTIGHLSSRKQIQEQDGLSNVSPGRLVPRVDHGASYHPSYHVREKSLCWQKYMLDKVVCVLML